MNHVWVPVVKTELPRRVLNKKRITRVPGDGWLRMEEERECRHSEIHVLVYAVAKVPHCTTQSVSKSSDAVPSIPSLEQITTYFVTFPMSDIRVPLLDATMENVANLVAAGVLIHGSELIKVNSHTTNMVRMWTVFLCVVVVDSGIPVDSLHLATAR